MLPRSRPSRARTTFASPSTATMVWRASAPSTGTGAPWCRSSWGKRLGDLRQAFRRAARAWRAAAVFGEVRLREAADTDEAQAVLRWHDAPGVLSTPADCVGPVTGAASTLGCLNHTRDALRSWPRRDGEVSQVFFRVVIRRTDDQELLDRLVIHEMGHVLGILSHSPDPSDIMWAGPDLPPAPSARDRSTLRSLYMTPVDLPVETPSRGG